MDNKMLHTIVYVCIWWCGGTSILWNGSNCRSREHQSEDLPCGFTAGLFNISYALAHFQSLHTPSTFIFIFLVVELRLFLFCTYIVGMVHVQCTLYTHITKLSVSSRFLVLICL